MIRFVRAPAYATIQDAGRRGHLAYGVPRSGVMDAAALHTLNALLGNDAGAAAIEIALTGGEMVFENPHTFAIGGANASIALDGNPLESWSAHRGAAGQTLSIGAPTGGRFVYIAVAGGIDCPVVMGSRSTYLPGEFGGLGGRRIKAGDVISIGNAARRRRHHVSDPLQDDLRPKLGERIVRFIARGESTLERSWRISVASDRTGYRLESEPRETGASIVSEPICPGVIQLPPGGEPIILMADAPTIGGYRIAGTVISADLRIVAQCPPGEEIILEKSTVARAQSELARSSEVFSRVREWSLA